MTNWCVKIITIIHILVDTALRGGIHGGVVLRPRMAKMHEKLNNNWSLGLCLPTGFLRPCFRHRNTSKLIRIDSTAEQYARAPYEIQLQIISIHFLQMELFSSKPLLFDECSCPFASFSTFICQCKTPHLRRRFCQDVDQSRCYSAQAGMIKTFASFSVTLSHYNSIVISSPPK